MPRSQKIANHAEPVARNGAVVKKSSLDRSSLPAISDFNNIKLVCNHFNPALEEYQTAHRAKFLTPEKVMGELQGRICKSDI